MTGPGTIGTDEGRGANARAGQGPDGNHNTQPTQCDYKQPTQALTPNASP